MKFNQIFLEKFEYIKKLYEVLTKEYEVEHLHKYRVNLRKIYAYNNIFCKNIDENRAKEFSKLLKQVIKPTSLLRDLDLFIIEIDTLTLNSQTKESLCKIFELQREPLLKEIESKDYKKSLYKLAHIFKTETLFKTDFDEINSYTLLSSMSQKLSERFFKISEETALKDLHKLRIKFKKFRYALELYDALFENGSYSVNKMFDLKDLQDLFGIMQDNEVRKMLIESIGDEIGEDDKTLLISGFEKNIINAKQELLRLKKELDV